MSLLSKLLFIVTVIYAVFQAPTLRLQMPCIVLKMLKSDPRMLWGTSQSMLHMILCMQNEV